jgi:hypothetical protein
METRSSYRCLRKYATVEVHSEQEHAESLLPWSMLYLAAGVWSRIRGRLWLFGGRLRVEYLDRWRGMPLPKALHDHFVGCGLNSGCEVF